MAVLVLLGAAAAACGSSAATLPTSSPSSVTPPDARTVTRVSPALAPVLDRARHSTTDPASPWVVVNKTHPIAPLGFRPRLALVRGYQVARLAAGPLNRLLAAGDRQGLGLKIASAFRSYDYQASVHVDTVAARGSVGADRVSARPGYSEHQTGLAVDLVTPADPACDFDACFADTPAGRWLAADAWRFGFLVRYQPDITATTGYGAEPWHLRYVGRSLAVELRRTGVRTLEEFFDVPGGDYPR